MHRRPPSSSRSGHLAARLACVVVPLALTVAAGCGDSTSPADQSHPVADMASGSAHDQQMETGDAGSPIPAATQAVLTTTASDFQSGTLDSVKLVDKTVRKAIDTTLSGDNNVRCQAGTCYVLDQTPHGTVRLYDPATFAVKAEIKAGDDAQPAAKGNPHDVLPVEKSSKLYVALFGNDGAHAVGVLDTAQPGKGVVKWIAVPVAPADPDGKPEANNLHACGGLVYVTLEDLDETKGFAPTGPGRIAVIDPATDMVVGAPIALAGQNPTNVATEGTGCDRLLVSDSANQFVSTSGAGGIERVDLSTRKSLGWVAKDSDLGGHPAAISTASATVAWVVLNSATTSQVAKVDLSTGKVVAMSAPAGYVAFAKVTPDRSALYVGVSLGDPAKGQLAPGLYVVPADGNGMLTAPIDLGQSPNAIAFQ